MAHRRGPSRAPAEARSNRSPPVGVPASAGIFHPIEFRPRADLGRPGSGTGLPVGRALPSPIAAVADGRRRRRLVGQAAGLLGGPDIVERRIQPILRRLARRVRWRGPAPARAAESAPPTAVAP